MHKYGDTHIEQVDCRSNCQKSYRNIDIENRVERYKTQCKQRQRGKDSQLGAVKWVRVNVKGLGSPADGVTQPIDPDIQ
jgi:hypothetical protein